MTISRKPQSSVEALNGAITSYKSVISDYHLRAKQAEEMVAQLLNDKLTPEQRTTILTHVMQVHMEARGKERAIHLVAVIEALQIALHACLLRMDKNSKEETRAEIQEVLKNLAVAMTSSKN